MTLFSYSDTLEMLLSCFSHQLTEQQQQQKTLLATYQEGEGSTTKAAQFTGKVLFSLPIIIAL